MFKFNEFTKDLNIRQVDLKQILNYSQASISKLSTGNGFSQTRKFSSLLITTERT